MVDQGNIGSSQASGPSGYDWLNAVWSGSDERSQSTLNSQLVDANSVAIATGRQAALGSTNQQFHVKGVANTPLSSGNYTISQVIAIMSGMSGSNSSQTSAMSTLNSVVANMQQEQSLNTQTAGQGVQMTNNQLTQVDPTNQNAANQTMSSINNFLNQMSGLQVN